MHNIIAKNASVTGVYETTVNKSGTAQTTCKVSGTISTEINAIDSMQFTIYPDNLSYDEIIPYKTRIISTNVQDDEIEFCGRVLKSKPVLTSSGEISKNVVCENYMGFLCDSTVELKVYKGTVQQVIDTLFTEHENQIGKDSFWLAECDITEEIEIESEGESTYAFIMNKIVAKFGGEFELLGMSERTEGGLYYSFSLALRKETYNISSNEIKIGDNLISYSSDEDATNLCTRIIPYGAKIYTDEDNLERVDITEVNSGKNYIDDENSEYGCIARTIIFQDIEDPTELKTEAEKYLEENRYPKDSYQIVAFDNHMFDTSIPKISLRNWYYVNAPILGAERLLLRITKKTICIENPANDTFTVGDTYNLSASSAVATSPTTADINKVYDNIYTLDRISTHQINAIKANLYEIESNSITTKNLVANIAKIDNLTAEDAIIKNIASQVLSAEVIKTAVAEVGYLTATEADIRYMTATSANLKFASIDLSNIAAGTITQAMIGTGAIGTVQIADGSITSAKIVELTAEKITTGTLSVDRLVISGSEKSIIYAINNSGELVSTSVDTIDGATLTKRSITADIIVANAITGNEIAANAITANNIVAGAITTDKLSAASITSIKIATSAITSEKIAAGAITTDKLAAHAVTADKINVNDLFAQTIHATGTITGAKIKGALGEFTNGFSVLSYLDNSSTDCMSIQCNDSAVNIGVSDINGNFDSYASMSLCNTGELYLSAYNVMSIYGRSGVDISSHAGVITLSETVVNGGLVSNGTFTANSSIMINSNIYMKNNIAIYAKNSTGTNRALLSLNNNNNLVIGNGGYNASEGYTNIYGNAIALNTKVNALFSSNSANGHFYPSASGVHRLGSSNYKWQYLYATNGTIQTSDQRYKENIVSLSQRYEVLFDRLRAVSYRWKNIENTDNHDRTRVGFIAQEVKSAMDAAGLSDKDFAGWCKDPVYPLKVDATGNEIEDTTQLPIDYIYGLNYDSFIPLCVWQIQKIKKSNKDFYLETILPLLSAIQSLKAEVEILKNSKN